MNRRNLLKVLPLAAMTGTAINLGEVEAVAHEMKPGKRYLFVTSAEISVEQARTMQVLLEKRGINATICRSDDLKIYELE